jgi:FixJ family two-component response regulator
MPSRPLIFVVDDDSSVLRALGRLIRSHGSTSCVFSSGQEFLRAISDGGRPDCIVLDVQMPEMSGLDVQVRLQSLGINIPIIFITAHEDQETENLALARGAVAFFYKPIPNKVLWAAICSTLGSGNVCI